MTSNPADRESAVVILADELLQDVELDRTILEAMLFKARRLARLAANERLAKWISYELYGYDLADPIGQEFALYTARWTDKEKNLGYFQSSVELLHFIETTRIQLDTVRAMVPHGDHAAGQLQHQEERISNLSVHCNAMRRIVVKVRVILQDFVQIIYYEQLFGEQATRIFEIFKREVDGVLAARSIRSLERMPHVFRRISVKEPESISQGMLVCRRTLDDFIDSIFPPSDNPSLMDELPVTMTTKDTKNRYRAYIKQRTASQSHADKLIRSILLIYDRTSTAVHSDVTPPEAEALALQLYLTLGEIIRLGDVPAPPPPASFTAALGDLTMDPGAGSH